MATNCAGDTLVSGGFPDLLASSAITPNACLQDSVITNTYV